MNKTKIEWTDFTWNPVTGCWGPGGTAEKPNRCPYCYAQRVAKRFIYHDGPDAFAPIFHPERLSQPSRVKKPSKIFVCSMADLLGDWVPKEWIMEVLWCVLASPHTFQFLTKNPKRLKDFNPWPRNAWVGCTVTNQSDADERLPWLLQADAPVRFVSHEPLLGEIKLQENWLWKPYHAHNYPFIKTQFQWAIIGAMTGPGAVKSEPEWVSGLIRQYQVARVPVFLKDNLYPPGAPATVKFQDWPT